MTRSVQTRAIEGVPARPARAVGPARGHLKIFLGAAPGVGKTFAMLEAARLRLAEGIDVVAAIVETHGRRETQAMLDGLETVPRRFPAGGGAGEMDLDAVLVRRPTLALVDEFAHTNADGSRHPKRYGDVAELLAAGIDVYTTLNVQHVESLNTVVAQITRVRVRETVPDSMLDRADDIEVIDLAPADLIARMREGKVYVPRQAERALRHFFSPGNLTALRELALRRTAQRVDEQLRVHMQTNAIVGPWAAGDRVLVCVGDAADTSGLVRHAKRVADRLHAPAIALHVETTRSLALSNGRRDRIAEALRLAGRLGLEAVTVPSAGSRVADDVLDYARANNVTQILVGKATRSRWFEMMNGSVVFDLVRKAGNISVHVIAIPDTPGTPDQKASAAKPKAAKSPYAWVALMVAAALGAAELIQPLLGATNIDLVFLTAVVGAAISFGLHPSLFAVLLSTLAFNFFFLPPLYTFTVADPSNVAALFFFTLVAVLVSNLTARVRSQATLAGNRARTTEALFAFSRKLASCVGTDDVLWAMAYQIASMLKVRVVVLLPDDGGQLALRAGYPPEDELPERDRAAAQWCWERNEPAGRGAETLPGAPRFFAPLRTGRAAVGVVGIDNDNPGELMSPDGHRLFESLLDQGASAVERVSLGADLDRVRRAAENDKLREALLRSLSHDLRTPLAAVLGAATTIREFDASLDDKGRLELVATIVDEAERLNRFIANLLDMTRLESGAIAPNLEDTDSAEAVGAALRRATRVLGAMPVTLSIAPDLPPMRVDPVLLEQALFNIFDNAAKYAPGSALDVRVEQDGAQIVVAIRDHGPGIPEAELEAVFGKFHRVRKTDQVRAGTGLGLAIARGFVEAMNGSVDAGPARGGGATLTLRLPIAANSRS